MRLHAFTLFLVFLQILLCLSPPLQKSFEFSVLDQIHPFWVNLVQKTKIVSLSWNLVPVLIWISTIQWWCSVFPFLTENVHLGRGGETNLVQKIKITSLSWNLVPGLIQICTIHWRYWLYLFLTKNTLFGKFDPKNQNCQFKLKFGSKINSKMLNSVVMFTFCFRPETPFSDKFNPKSQNCQFWLKFGT